MLSNTSWSSRSRFALRPLTGTVGMRRLGPEQFSVFKLLPTFLLVCFVAMQPTRSNSEAAFALGRYRTSDWAFGMAHNRLTQAEAETAAVNDCRRRNQDCSVRLTFRDTCFAFAVQTSDNGVTTGLNDDIVEAKREALANCAMLGTSCSVRGAFCDNVIESAEWSPSKQRSRLLAMFVVLQYLGATALGIMLVWLALTPWLGKSLPRELRTGEIAEGCVVCAIGLVCGFVDRHRLFPDYEWPVLLVGVGALFIGTASEAFNLGLYASASINGSSWPTLRIRILVFSIAALGIYFTLRAHYLYGLLFDEPILVGTLISWLFVLGYVIDDPAIAPFLQKLDKILSWIQAVFLSLASSSRQALASIWEAAVAQRNVPPPGPSQFAAAASAHQDRALVVAPVSFPSKMNLKLRRSQGTSVRGKIIFMLDARMEVPREEYELIGRYGLGSRVIYDSADRKAYNEAMQAQVKAMKQDRGYGFSAKGQLLGAGKALYRLARVGVTATMALRSLRITVYSLMSGVHVECDNMEELLAAEEAINEASQKLRNFLDQVATFDGREEIREF